MNIKCENICLYEYYVSILKKDKVKKYGKFEENVLIQSFKYIIL